MRSAALGHEDDLQAVAKRAIVGRTEVVLEALLLGRRQVDTDHERGSQSSENGIERSFHYTRQHQPECELERLVKASSNEGDTVLDPFCGCGTAIHAAQRLGRRWIGIDVTHLAVALIRKRLLDAFDKAVEATYEVIGEPTSLPDAATLAKQDPFQFQCWCVGKLGASPLEQKKGSDRGIDGRIYFVDDAQTGNANQVIFSVKGGHIKPGDVRDLRGMVEREKAAIGVFVCLETPTREMEREVASAGFYEPPFGNAKYPRLQIVTVEDIIAGKAVAMPPMLRNTTFKKAPRAKPAEAPKPKSMFDRAEEE